MALQFGMPTSFVSQLTFEPKGQCFQTKLILVGYAPPHQVTIGSRDHRLVGPPDPCILVFFAHAHTMFLPESSDRN